MPLLVIISGPSGAGKTSVINNLTQRYPDLVKKVITTTTRPPRNGEKSGVHYDFMSRSEFVARVERGEFVEHMKNYGQLYGTRAARLREVLATHPAAILSLDPDGAVALQRIYRETVRLSIFIRADRHEVAERLKERGDDRSTIFKRVERFGAEMALAQQFDHQVTNRNEGLDQAVAEVLGLIKAEVEEKVR